MRWKATVGALRYFDLAVTGMVLVVMVALLLAPSGRPVWTPTNVFTVLLVTTTYVVFLILRRRGYAHDPTSLVGAVAAVLAVALLTVFSQAPLMWSIVILAAGVALLLIAIVAPTKQLGEPITRIEIFKLVALSGSICFTIVVVEAFLRLAPGIFDAETQQMLASTPDQSGVGHPYIGHLHRPDRTFEVAGRDFDAAHSVDAYGFRNPWPWPEQTDIVAVGDSLTFGLGVEDHQSWPALVQAATGHEVISLGLVGAGPHQYLRLYETFGAKLAPRLLLVGIYAQNDFWDDGQFHQWEEAGVGDNYMVWRNFGRPMRYDFSLRHPIQTAEGVFRAHVYPVVRSSHLYNLLRAVRGGETAAAAPVKAVEFPDGGRMVLMPADFLSKTEGATRDRWEFELVWEALETLHAQATQQGTRVVMVLQPSKEEVYMPLLGESVPDPTADLRQAFDQAGIEYLDLAPEFRRRADAGERLFFEVDSHPNERGYALIGELVAAHIMANASRYLDR